MTGALLALAFVYAYVVGALFVHARLSSIAPPRSLARAIAIGAIVPACGCTALAIARRAAPRERAPFLVAAYAGSPLLVAATWLMSGPLASLAVLALALVAAALARAVPPGDAPLRARLDDLLLRRDASPLRDAAPYLASYGAPALAVGALVGAAASVALPVIPTGTRVPVDIDLGAILSGAAFVALAVALAAPRADVASDHGAAFARRVFALHVAFALAGGVTVAAWAWR